MNKLDLYNSQIPRFSFVKNERKYMSDNFMCPLCGQPMVITSCALEYDENIHPYYSTGPNPVKMDVDTFCPNGCIKELHMCISQPVAVTHEY